MRSRFICCALALLSIVSVVSAQAPRQVPLGRPTAAYAEPFGLVTTVRELSDGRVVIADPLGGEVTILEADLSRGRQVGREGSGPGEYRQPDAVWALPGDTTLVVDLGNARLSFLSPSGTFIRSIPMLLGAFQPGAGGPPPAVLPGGTDSRGRIYFQARGFGRDSAEVMRLDPASGKVDTVAVVKLPAVDMQSQGGEGTRQVRVRPIPLAGSDGWAVAPNGDLGVVRLNDYHLEWIGTGARRVGRPVGLPAVRIGNAEKEEWIDEQQLTGGIGMSVEASDGRVNVSFSRGRGGQGRPDAGQFTWPAQKPPFDAGTTRVDPRGRLWVLRHQVAKQAPLYDVFGPEGNLIGSVRFPAGRRLAGFGRAGLYVAAADSDGLQRLERYALPL